MDNSQRERLAKQLDEALGNYLNAGQGNGHNLLYTLGRVAYDNGYDTDLTLEGYLTSAMEDRRGRQGRTMDSADVDEVRDTARKVVREKAAEPPFVPARRGGSSKEPPADLAFEQRMQDWQTRLKADRPNENAVGVRAKAAIEEIIGNADCYVICRKKRGDSEPQFLRLQKHRGDREGGGNENPLPEKEVFCLGRYTSEACRAKDGAGSWDAQYIDRYTAVFLETDLADNLTDEQKRSLTDEQRRKFRDSNLMATTWLLAASGLKPNYITYSGNKSFHCIFILKNTVGPDEWKRMADMAEPCLISMHDRIGTDHTNVSKAPFTRIPFNHGNEFVKSGQFCIWHDPAPRTTPELFVAGLRKAAAMDDPSFSWEEKAAQETGPEEPRLTVANILQFVRDQGWTLWTDAVTRERHLDGERTLDGMTAMVSAVRDRWTEAYGLKIGRPRQEFQDALEIAFQDRANERNLFAEWARSAPWDGKDRIGEMCDCWGISDDLSRRMVRTWMRQTMAITFNGTTGADGVPIRLQTNCVLTLEGPGRIGKTVFFGSLMGDNHGWIRLGHSIDVNNKDSLIPLETHAIVELGELEGTLKREQDSLKAIITAPVRSVRRPYAREAVDNPTRVSICASVNDERFIRKAAGSERFLIIKVERCDWDGCNAIDRQQVWAQALREIEDGPGLNGAGMALQQFISPDREMLDGIAERNDTKLVDSGYVDAVAEAFDLEAPRGDWKWRPTRDVATILLNPFLNIQGFLDEEKDIDPRSIKTPGQKDIGLVGQALNAHHFEKRTVHGAPQWRVPPVRKR